VSFIRGTPLLVQLFVIYYGLAQFGLRLDPIPSALIGLSLNVGGYTGEILRAAIASIDKGQWEASRALGLSWGQAMRLVILPQAARVALPPLGNSFIALVKDTSLAATIQVPELFRQAQLITARTFQIFTMYLTAAILYWVMSTALAWLQNRLERHYSRQFEGG
jgi:cystine transport system permease protein